MPRIAGGSTGVDPFDVSTWDVPEIMRDPKPQVTPFIPNRALRRRLRRGRTQQAQRPLPSHFRQPDAPKTTGQVERLDFILRHPEAEFLPEEVVLSAANSDFEGTELRKAVRFMARETDIDPANLFAEGEQIQMNGREARRVARKREEEFLERGLRTLTAQFNAQIPVLEAQNAKLKLDKVSTREAARALNAIWENLDVDDVKLDKILGTAVQVAAGLGSRKAIDAFAHNLRLLREGNDGAPWVYQVSAAESLGAYKAATVLDIYDRTGMSGLDRNELREQAFKTSIAEHGLHVWYDAKGERHQYVWDPFQGKWRDVNTYEFLAGAQEQGLQPELDIPAETFLQLAARQFTPLGVAEELVAKQQAKLHERSDPPFMWGDPEGAAPNQSILAGLIGGSNLKFSGARVKDYYAEARKLARDLEMKQYAWEASVAGRLFQTTIETLDFAWRHVEGGLVRATTFLSAPIFGAAAAVTPGVEFTDWWDEMHRTAGEIEAGRNTIGIESARNLGLPEWSGVLALDLPAAFALDPLIWIGRAARLAKAPYLPDEFLLSGKRVSYMGRGLEWMSERNRIFRSFRPLGQWLQKGETFPQFAARMSKRFGKGGEAVARRIWDAGRRFDERIGLPLSGMYESRGEALEKFADWYFNKPKRWLGGKTLSGFMVDHRLANPDVDLYSVLNERMKGLYNREAFHPELTRSVEQIVDVAKMGGLHRDQMILTTDELLRAGMGMKQLDPATLERLIIDPSTLGGPIDDLGFSPTVRNSVGDLKWTNRPGHVRPRKATLPDADLAREFRDYDAAFAREVLDEVSLRFGGTGLRGQPGFRPLQFEFPRPARARRLMSAVRKSPFGQTSLGRVVDAAFANRVPEAMVQFEAGRFPVNVERRIWRSRVFSQEEQAQELALARRISEASNPNREHQIINYLEGLTKRTWDRLAGEYGIPEAAGARLFEEITKRTDQVNFDMAKEAFGVKAVRLEDGTIELESLGRPLVESQLPNQWFVHDPLAMRRGIREAIGTWKATESFVQNVARDFRALGRQIDPEVGASLERAVFHDQIDDSLSALGWTVPQRQWAKEVWDVAASSALRNRPDLYETADDFFKSVGIRHAKEFSGAAPEGARFRRVVEADPDVGRLARELDEFLGENPTAELWYDASVQALEELAPKYFFSTTVLEDGTEVADFDLFTQILAVTSARRSPEQNLAMALDTFLAIKTGGRIEGMPSSVRGMVRDIVKGNTMDKWEGTLLGGDIAPSAQKRLKVWNFWNNLNRRADNVTVDTWMARLFGFSDKFTPSEYLQMQDLVRQIAAQAGMKPMHAQAALWGMYKSQYADKVSEWAQVLRRRAAELELSMVNSIPGTEAGAGADVDIGLWNVLSRQVDDVGSPGIAREGKNYVFRDDDGVARGVLDLDLDAQGQGVVHISVDPTARRQGIASRLVVQAVEDQAVSPEVLLRQGKTAQGEALARGLQAKQGAKQASKEVAELVKDAIVRGLDPEDTVLFLDTTNPEALLITARTFERQLPALRDARHYGDLVQQDKSLGLLDQIKGTGPAQVKKNVNRWLKQTRGGSVSGMFEPLDDYRGVIHLFETGDVDTFVHETAHFLRRILPDEDIAALEARFGGKFESVEVEEKFARALETYLSTRTAPASIRSAMQAIWDFLRGMWRKVRGSDEILGRKIDPTLRRLFDDWLPEEQIDLFPKALTDGEISDKVITTYARRLGEWVANDVYLRVWKPAMVLRFGYITRVPGFDEQVRFLIDAGLAGRIRSQGIVGSVAERLADRGYLPKGWVEEKTLIPTASGDSLEVVRRIPGALPDEAYANSTIRADEVYQTVAQQAKAVVRGAEKRYWGVVAPEAAEWGNAWDTAVNGHFATSIPGQRALRHIAEQTDKDQAISDLIAWATDDPMGRRVIKRIGVPTDEVPEWAEELWTTVRRYTVNDPNLAAAALRREATPQMIDEALRGFTDPAQARVASREGAQRELTALSEAKVEESVGALRTYIKANRGATWDPVTGKFYEGKGYAVAYRDGTAVSAPAEALESPEQFRKLLDDAMKKFGDDLESYDGLYFGAWLDDEGVIHLDPAEVVKDFNEAMGLGILRQQEAIFSFDTFDDIPVFGRPSVHGLRAENITGERVNPIRPIVDFASRWILQIPTNRLSRQPFFKYWYDRILDLQLEMAKTAKVLPNDVAGAERMVAGFRANARRFAIDRVQRVMFNFRDQSRLSEAMAFIVPFMQPFQEAFSVYGHLLRKNPAVAGYVNLAFRTAADTGFIKRNPDTGEWETPLSNWFFMAPLMGMVSHWPGMSMSAPLASFNLFFNNAFPISGGKLFGDVTIPMPGLSPPMTWLLQQFKDNDDSRLATWLYQYGDVGAKQILPFPYWLQHAITSVVPSWNQDAFTAYTDDFLKLQQYMGITYDNKQEAVAAAEAQAKAFFRYKSMISFLFPASPRIEFGFKHLEDEYRALVEKHEGNTALARDEFLAKHPKNWLIATAKTVWEREDPKLPGGQGTPSIPSTEIAERVLAQPGLKEFAQEFPAMAWAVLPQEAFTSGEYSPDVFRKQLAGADRRYLAPEEYYARGESQAGWVAYWHLREWLDASKEDMRGRNVQTNDPEWIQAHDDYEDKLANLRRMYPSFGDEFGDIEEQAIDPRVLAYNRELLKSKVFMDFPVGKGLKEYMDLRDGLKQEMAKAGISSIDSVSAVDAGIAKQYEDGVAEIIEKYPDFQRAYDVFFRGVDLTRVRSEAAKRFDEYLAKLPEQEREQIYEWQSVMNDFEDQIDLAPDEFARAPIYEQQAAHINAAYENFPKEGNPAIQWYEHQSYDAKQDIRNRALTKSFLFLNRFEREYILGIETDAQTEQIWQVINQTRSQISLRGKMDPNFSSAAAYEELNVWVAQQAAANPTFASHLDRANTWGWAFFSHSDLMKQDGPSGDAWKAFSESVRNYQIAVERADIHGVGADEAAYNAVRQQLIEYVGILKSWSATFGEQWDHLESGSTGDLIDTFMPPIWFRLGG